MAQENQNRKCRPRKTKAHYMDSFDRPPDTEPKSAVPLRFVPPTDPDTINFLNAKLAEYKERKMTVDTVTLAAEL